MIDLTYIARALRSLLNSVALDAAEEVLSGITLGTTINGAHVTLAVPNNIEAGHTLITGASGCGKTVGAQSMHVQMYLDSFEHAPPEKRLSLVIIDCAKGDFAEGFLHALAATAPERLADVHWLHPFSPGAFPLNFNHLDIGKTPLDIQAQQLAQLVASVSTAVGAQAHLGVGSRQLDVIVHLFLGVLSSEHAGANIAWALDALEIPGGLKRLASTTTHARAKRFLEHARLSPELTSSVKSRIRTALASTDGLERIVAADGSIQFAPMTASGQILICTVHEPPGGMVQLSQFYANLFCRLILTHLLERTSPWQLNHTRIFVDEAQVVSGVLADVFEHIETTGRSKGLSLALATQGLSLLRSTSESLFKVLLTNTPNRVVGRMNASDAELYAREQAPQRGVDESFSRYRQKLAAGITSLGDRDFYLFRPGKHERYRSLDVDMVAWQEAAVIHADAIKAVKERYALPCTSKVRVTLAEATEVPKKRRKKPAPKQKAQATKKEIAEGQENTDEKVEQKQKKPRSKWG